MSSVRVAVRVRPFNSREKEMNSKCCLTMVGNATTIVNPESDEPKTFSFDYSYWSHDGFREGPDGELISTSDRYATQKKVYDDVGADVLNSAFEGYNSTLFAYGQTGAGKSFSMVGYGVNKGIIPMVCSEMFKAVDRSLADPNSRKKYQVTVTMLEIYNEAIRDLLNPSVNIPGGLKVRSKPGVGVYVERLTPVAVANYEEIEKRMEEGTSNRTVASTKMNATSSRAHTVFGIIFTCIESIDGVDSEIQARMNLVDLAGSERAESTGATGDRLKEGCAINASLSALGNVISALADIAMGKKKVFVPYRNSALTRLLQDALGGNSRTIMIAALSPADVNFDETLGTLRYADRAKKIKNNVSKMENPTDKIIRMLKEENARLLALLSGKGISVPVAASGEGGGDLEEMKAKLMAENQTKLEEQMKENEKIIEDMKKSWEQKLAESSQIQTSTAGESGAVSIRAAAASNLSHIINLHEDPQLSECLVYMFKKGVNRIGNKSANTKQDIVFSGLNILPEHAVVETDDNNTCVISAVSKSKTFVNGDLVTAPLVLHTGDRVILGNNFVFRFVNPSEPLSEEAKQPRDNAWSEAIEEFSTKQNLRISQSLGGEMGKLEEEEAAKRKELEQKLAKMEDDMRKERELARNALEQQKNMFINSGGELTDAQKAQLASFEDAYNNKTRNLEEEISKRREISEKIIQEQMKRKRQTKKIEEKLAKLMPLINEANSMAEELNKPVRFEARLAVKSTNVNLSALDELRNLKTIDITIRVVSQDNGNVWTWNHVKFDSRLYMMREIYQEFMDFGPRPLPKSKDPFWDPPEAIEIGKAYVYLKALSQLVEIENDFAIVDYKGDEQGTLTVDIYPEGPNGEELDYLASSDELLGSNVTFRVNIPQAKNLPSKYNNDVYVSFTFNGETKETEACEMKTSDPKFKFEARFKMEGITEENRQYLLKDAAVFEVRGFSDPQVIQTSEGKAGAGSSSSGSVAVSASAVATQGKPVEDEVLSPVAAPGTSDGTAAPVSQCSQCEEKQAAWECVDCQKDLCEGCFALLHKSAKKANHNRVALNAAAAGVAVVQCAQCEEKSAIVKCVECGDKVLCDGCNQLLHKSAKKQEHTRLTLDGLNANAAESAATSGGKGAAAAAAPAAIQCQQCEEQSAKVCCSECLKNLCDGCNALLHKSAKKAGHVRSPL